MLVQIRNRVEVDESYRVARAYGLFNVIPDMAQEFNLDVDVPIERHDWRIGVVYGPSGSGKTSIARALAEHGWSEHDPGWPANRAIVDAIDSDGDFEAVTSALASVGLGTVPSWLRPYHVLSNGEKFRADLARLLADGETDIFVDEFTSVLDRQVAGFGAQAFSKAWRRAKHEGRVIFLTPHHDVLGWLQPDWVIKTSLAGNAQLADSADEVAPGVERPDSPVVATVSA